MEEENKNQKRVLTDEELMNVSGGVTFGIAYNEAGEALIPPGCYNIEDPEICEARKCRWNYIHNTCQNKRDSAPIIL